MNRVIKDLIHVTNLDDAPQVHNRNPIRSVANHGEVVRHHQVTQPQARAEFLKQVNHTRLNGNIQSRYRFVQHHKFRVYGKRTGNTDTLALTARELVREAVHVIGLQTHDLHQLNHALFNIRTLHALVFQGLGKNLVYGKARVEGARGVLENHLLVLTQFKNLADRFMILRRDTVNQNLAIGFLAKLHNFQQRGGFTTPGFAHD